MSNETESIENDIDKYAKLESLALSEGGVLLLDSLKSDVTNAVDTLIAKYKELSHIEMIAIIARLEARLSLYRSISRSSKNKKMAKDALKEIIREDI
jgi:hypothetical protein